VHGVATASHRESGSGLQRGARFSVTEGEEECRQVGDSMYGQEHGRVFLQHTRPRSEVPLALLAGRRGSN